MHIILVPFFIYDGVKNSILLLYCTRKTLFVRPEHKKMHYTVLLHTQLFIFIEIDYLSLYLLVVGLVFSLFSLGRRMIFEEQIGKETNILKCRIVSEKMIMCIVSKKESSMNDPERLCNFQRASHIILNDILYVYWSLGYQLLC